MFNKIQKQIQYLNLFDEIGEWPQHLAIPIEALVHAIVNGKIKEKNSSKYKFVVPFSMRFELNSDEIQEIRKNINLIFQKEQNCAIFSVLIEEAWLIFHNHPQILQELEKVQNPPIICMVDDHYFLFRQKQFLKNFKLPALKIDRIQARKNKNSKKKNRMEFFYKIFAEI